jgi:lipopolysaccharide/colanic/teichoic acid biosynthesis glycosyltransferase
MIILAAPIVVPVIAVLALLVMRDGKSAFYTQNRIGRDGSYYKIWKLRTMVANADELLASYLASNPEAAAEWEATQKLKNDPRVTSIGRILRKTSLDELPQLLNVFVGDMSLVGPRPMLPEQQAMYPGRAYYTQRPGITGTWQISDRNSCSFSERARFDSDYISNISFIRDFGVLLATVRVVVKGTGY